MLAVEKQAGSVFVEMGYKMFLQFLSLSHLNVGTFIDLHGMGA